MKARFSILIVNWNSWELLTVCLKALAIQSVNEFNLFVIDNASDNPPPNEIFSIIPHLVFVQNSYNYGFAKANNILISQAKDSDWIVLLNPDTIPKPDWLENLSAASAKYVDYQFFASRLLMSANNDNLDGDGDSYHMSGVAWRNGHGGMFKENRLPIEVFSACAAAAMYKSELLLKVGGFDEDFFCYNEDTDLGFRLRLMGAKCLLVPSAVVYHSGSATTGGQKGDFAVYYGHRNLVWTYVKDMPSILFWMFLPFHLILNLVSLLWFTMRGQMGVIFRAKLDAVKSLPSMWQKRRVVQLQRVIPSREIWRVINKKFFNLKRYY